MATAIKGEVGDDTLDGDAAFAEEIVLIIAFMPRETLDDSQLLRDIREGRAKSLDEMVIEDGEYDRLAEKLHRQDLERVKSFRYMDDDFMTACLADNFEGVELILQIVLGRTDIKVTSVRTQELMKNLQGRVQKGRGITAVCWIPIY